MKIIFFLTLLINIALFFWEFSSNKSQETETKNPKQILLLSELPKKERKDSISPRLVKPTKKINPIIVSETKVIKTPTPTNIIKVPAVTEISPIAIPVILAIKKPIVLPKEQAKPDQEKIVITDRIEKKEKKAEKVSNDLLCYQVGPFENMAQLRRWTHTNKIKEGSFNYINKGEKNKPKYLVYFPIADSSEQIQKNIDYLTKKGITDSWLFKQGDLKGAISLGVFVKEKRALLQQNQFRKKGVVSKITPLYAEGAIIFAEFLTTDKKFKHSLTLSNQLKITPCL